MPIRARHLSIVLHKLLHLERFITDVTSSTEHAFPPLLHLPSLRPASLDVTRTPTHHTSPPCRSRRSSQTLPTATQAGRNCAQQPPRLDALMLAPLPPASAYLATLRVNCTEATRTLWHEHGRQSDNLQRCARKASVRVARPLTSYSLCSSTLSLFQTSLTRRRSSLPCPTSTAEV